MRVYIPRQEIMAMTGSGLLKLMQNEHTPKLDLFVRESVQNSLDASLKGAEKTVVDLGCGNFIQKELSPFLEGVTESLNRKFPQEICNYLYIRDYAKGLRGPLHFSEKRDSEERDLQKLIYEVAKPQEAAGAGGSWGLGKTVYFRMGIGLVLYYSRIENNGRYQSRMAACLVEDENEPASILNGTELNAERGMAWWGESIRYHDSGKELAGTIPITDCEEIERIISVFGIEPFRGDETGTVIIIPYIDEKELLGNNINKAEEGEWQPPWLSKIEKYLEIAIQRWYSPRLRNSVYSSNTGRAWLDVSVNGKTVGSQLLRPAFEEFRKMYNMCINNWVSKKENGYFVEEIKAKKYFESSVIGWVAYKKFDRESLNMLPPDNEPDPFEYIWNNAEKRGEASDERVILAFTRKPGMIVSYETSGEWVKGIKVPLRENEYLMGIFVLNSENCFAVDSSFNTIEDYFRASEEADHSAWYDMHIGSEKPKILKNLQVGVKNRINNRYKKESVEEEKCNSVLSRLFSDTLLPPEGFGKKATKKAVKESSPKGISAAGGKKIRASIGSKGIRYEQGRITVPVKIEGTLDCSGADFSLQIVTDGKSIPVEKWNEMTGTEIPFAIGEAVISEITINGLTEKRRMEISYDYALDISGLCISITGDGNRKGTGIYLSSESKCSFSLKLNLTVDIYDSSIQMDYIIRERD